MLSYLRVKIAGLTAEAKRIRIEEQKLLGKKRRSPEDTPEKVKATIAAFTSKEEHFGVPVIGPKKRVGGRIPWAVRNQNQALADDLMEEYMSLRKHRTREIRPEARAAHLAYGFIRDMEYRRMEKEGSKAPNVGEIRRLINKYGPVKVNDDGVKKWCGIEEPEVERIPDPVPKVTEPAPDPEKRGIIDKVRDVFGI